MNIINDQKKCMASLAVFRQLFNSGNDIFSIVAEFVKQEIISEGLTDFSEQQMHDMLLKDNGFDVPQAVIHTAMKRIPFLKRKKDGAVVSTELSLEVCAKFRLQMENATNIREQISTRLVAYANSKLGKPLSEEEEKDLCKSFYAYVVDDKAPTRFSELACSFILDNQNDCELQSHLNLIREGAISFIGLTYYNNSYGSVDSFNKDIYIYLETEILFHMAGYNGLTYKNLFEEFYNQVIEINKQHQSKNGKKIIHLCYFTETLNEINDYFEQAEKIIRRSKMADPSKAAMHSLINGISEPSAIAERRAEFDHLLKIHGIEHDDFSYNLSNNKGNYCIDYETFVKDKDDVTANKIYSDLTLLNWIYIKRNKRHIESFANITAILLTGNYHVMQLAMDERLRHPKELALSATLDFLTTRLWFSLCKGLSKDCHLLSASVLTKARLALAALNCESINRAYKELETEMSGGEYDKELMKSRIASLHRRFRMPEDIDEMTDKNNIAFFTDCRADILLAEESARESAHKVEIDCLTHNIQKKEREIGEQNDMMTNILKDRLFEINNKEESEYNERMTTYNADKRFWVDEAMQKYRNQKLPILLLFGVLLLSMIIVPLVTSYFSHEITYLGILLSALLSVCNRISALKNTTISQGIDYLYKSEREKLRRDFERQYCEIFPVPKLCLTSMDDLIEHYKKK